MWKRINRLTDEEFFILIQDNDSIIALFQLLEVIPELKECKTCNKPMNVKPNAHYLIGRAWKCSKCKCRVNIMDDCILKGLKVTPKVFLKFAFYFFDKQHFSRDYVMRNSKIGEETYSILLNLVRKKISEFIIRNKRPLGGILKEVQIDETYWAKRKYNVGDLGKPVWVWGAIEFKSGYCYCQVVEDRKATTLLPIINSEIKDKSYVVSDKWASYNNIQNKYRDTVNHTYNFVDPISKANTQKIENMWLHLKKIKHYTYGLSLETLQEHLNVFMFFRNFKDIEFADFLIILLK
ncbi:hypothetical protein DMUE_6012 [Dictyocoela muelleri]|nr:hypothetical protein DMUE_6012 [Dictyocoela muelleri]